MRAAVESTLPAARLAAGYLNDPPTIAPFSRREDRACPATLRAARFW